MIRPGARIHSYALAAYRLAAPNGVVAARLRSVQNDACRCKRSFMGTSTSPAVVLVALCALVLSGAGGGCAKSVPLRVMTFNIRVDTPNDGPNQWQHRRDAVGAMLNDRKPDLIGIQEARLTQVEDLAARLNGYGWTGTGRDGEKRGEFAPIFYKSGKLELLEHGTFWLSDRPDEPSKGWDAAFPRVATWGKFRDRRTGRRFVMLNTHLDHVGRQARIEGAKLIVRRLQDISDGLPILLTADLNARPDSEPYRVMTDVLRDTTRAASAGHTGPEGTAIGWLGPPGRRAPIRPVGVIDYVLASPSVRVRWTQTLPEAWDGRQLSDHRAVLVDLDL